jgi:chromosome segregation ATPase
MNSGTYQIDPCNQACDYDYEVKVGNKEKDMLIAQLNAHIQELEQQEKDYDLLNQKFRQLQNEYSLLKDNKLRLEYELKQRDEAYNKKICDLRGENENLQLGFNEKISVGKKLLSDNDVLGKQLDMKNAEICDLNNKINDLSAQLRLGLNDKNCLEQKVQQLTEDKNNQKIEIDKLFEDNKKLSQIRQEQERNLKIGEQDRLNLASKINENNCEINNLNDKLRNHMDNIDQLQNKLDNSTALNCNLQNTIKDFERQINNFRNDNDNLKTNLLKEKTIRADEEKRNEELNQMINDRERKIGLLNQEYEQGKRIHQQISNDNNGFQIENDKLKSHIQILTCQNQKLIGELENVLEQDEKMNGPLSRRDKIAVLLRNNKMTLDQSANTLNEFISCGGNKEMGNSGTRIYSSTNNYKNRSSSPGGMTYSRINNA